MNKYETTVCMIILALLITTNLTAQNDFITTWQTDNAGSSGDTEITIPVNPSYTYSYDVDWDNDGTFDEFGLTGDVTHNFGIAGTYTIRIQGTFPAIYFNDVGDTEKLLSIDQWGTNVWADMNSAFKGCINMNCNAADTPDLSNVTDMSYMFYNCGSFNGDIGDWDVHTITSFYATFGEATVFNQDLSGWNVENAQDMEDMFYSAESFNQDISAWKVGNVTNMSDMFYRAAAFNQDLNTWDVSKVSNMAGMFREASSFNGDISNWNVGNVSNMEAMFRNAHDFNADISNWDVSKVTNMITMFSTASAFNQDIGKWNTASLINVQQCFTVARSFNQDLSGWDISNVISMSSMFDGTALSTANYDKLLKGWSEQTVQQNIKLGAMGKEYCHSAAYRDVLATGNGWTITDGGLDDDDANYFVITWQTDNPGTSADTEISIPTHPLYTYNYDVDWDNDGVFDELDVTGDVTHNYGTAGTQTIRIRGIFPGLYFNNGGDKEKLISIDQWGTIWWETMENAFNGCANMTCLASDVPDVSYVSNMDNAFLSAALFNVNASEWDVSELTSAENAFKGTVLSDDNYDKLLSGWGSQKVQAGVSLGTINNSYCMGTHGHDVLTGTYGWTINDLGSSCDEADYFVSTWKTDNTGTSGASSIIIPCNSYYDYFYDVDWDNDGVFDTFGITGDYEHTFDAPGTYTIRIRGVFPLFYFDNEDDKDKLISINQWGAIQWQSMESSFKGCSELTITATDAPDLSEVTTMEECFQYCTALNSSLNHWDVSNITNMYEVFEDATSFNGDISAWDVSSVTNMGDLFEGAFSFNQDISGWDVSSVQQTTDMFKDATSFNVDIGSWDVGSVTNMGEMFDGATAFNQDISEWDVSNVEEMYEMLNLCAMSTQNYDKLLRGWGTQALKSNVSLGAEGLSYCNAGSYRDELITGYGWSIADEGQNCQDTDYFITTWKTDNAGTSGDTEISITINDGYTYDYDIDWDNDGVFDELNVTGNITHDFVTAGTYTIQIRGKYPAIYFEDNSDSDKLLAVEQWGGILWESFLNAFNECENFNILATDAPELSQVTSFENTFNDCLSLNADLSLWDVSSVTNFTNTFSSSSFNGDLSDWDVSQATTLWGMFKGSDFNGDISEWDVSKVTDMRQLFDRNEVFNQDISSWNTESAEQMTSMFSSARSFNQDISGWNVGNVTDMFAMFSNAGSFDQNLGAWNLAGITISSKMVNMLYNTALSTANYDGILEGWAAQDVLSGINLGTVSAQYCSAGDARDLLINTHGWIINDNGAETDAPVPDEDSLSDIEAVNELTELTAPTASDCTGTIIGKHDAVLPITSLGTTLVTWTYEDENGNVSTQTQNVVITADTPTEVFEESIRDISIYPNPASNHIYINNSQPFDEYSRIELISMSGSTVVCKRLLQQNNSIDVSGVSEGIYLLKIYQKGTERAFKLIVRPGL
ncbi:MAG: BspA family leucine-rich repeat surface protein [Bacteroidales bacterium]|nr:BspA family leucine-rich repeat surface protein [Bacteroidales bacterium]